MNKNELQIKKKCKIVSDLTDSEGALYAGDEVVITDWTEVGTTDAHVVVTVKDILDRRHSVGLHQISPL